MDGSKLSDVEFIGFQNGNLICDPTDLPYTVSGHSTVVSDLGLITCGGNDGSYLSKCILQKQNGETTSFPSMKSNRYYFAMVLVSDVIYAIGGLGSSATMEMINLKTETEWAIQSIPFSVKFHCASAVSNTIVVTGGYVSGNVSK